MIAILLALAIAQCGGGSGRYDDERWVVVPNTTAVRAKIQVCIDKKECGLTSVYTARKSVGRSQLLVGFRKGRVTRPSSLPAGLTIMTYAQTLALMKTVKWTSLGP